MGADSGGHIDVNFDWSSKLNQRSDVHVEIEDAEHNRAGVLLFGVLKSHGKRFVLV